MKRIYVFLLAALLLSVSGAAQSRFGVKAGLNFNSMSDIKIKDLETSVQHKTGFHVGIVYQLKLPFGLALQPELQYTSKGATVKNYEGMEGIDADMKMNYLQLPVNLQWGADLVLFRPYIQVSPYVGYAIAKGGNVLENMPWKNLNKFSYGIGLGAGLEIWKFQVSGRYCWDLGKVADVKDEGLNWNGGKNKGFELSLALLF